MASSARCARPTRWRTFDPATVGFVECHGTATPLGDPIEYEALRKAFVGDDGIKRCALGSVKTNVGHLDIAAGITGLIKAALAVQNGRIPPTLHFTAPNPSIDLANGPFFVNTAVAAWPNGNALRRAGVSAFGVGGTNVHLVLEEAPARAQTPAADGSHLLVLSARSDAALAQARTNLAAHLRENPAVSLGDVARTLQSGRHAFDVRCALAAASLDEAAELLERNERIVSGRAGGGPPNVAFVFPGQGSQYPGMGRELYERIPAFRAAIDRCAEILRRGAGFELLDYLYRNDDAAGLTSTEIAQPAIFAIEYALAETLRRYGVVPVASAGHSVGEFVAATLAGVFSLEDGLSLVAERGRLMRGLPAGAMLVVRAGEAERPRAARLRTGPRRRQRARPVGRLRPGRSDRTPRGAAAPRRRDGAPPAHVARVPLGDDGADRRAADANGRRRDVACTRRAVRLDLDRNLDHARRGNVAVVLGAPLPRGGALRRCGTDARRRGHRHHSRSRTGRHADHVRAAGCRQGRPRQRAADVADGRGRAEDRSRDVPRGARPALGRRRAARLGRRRRRPSGSPHSVADLPLRTQALLDRALRERNGAAGRARRDITRARRDGDRTRRAGA